MQIVFSTQGKEQKNNHGERLQSAQTLATGWQAKTKTKKGFSPDQTNFLSVGGKSKNCSTFQP